ncbi:MAG: hypothetical protein MUP15_07245 [Dehalococcoidia bacterium]|nr:hypothetical protein [Dehalococcoidia bacterium]
MLDIALQTTREESIREWLIAGGTIGATAVALVLGLVAPWMRTRWLRPNINIDYEPREPYCRDTSLQSGHMAHWVRVKVTNRGRSTAKWCRGRMIEVYRTDGSLREDRDPMPLKWADMPEGQSLEPLDLARGESQFLAVVVATDDNKEVATIWTDLNARPGFPQTLEAGQVIG